MAEPDFDAAAATLMRVAYSSSRAREIIAHTLHMTWLQGRGDGLQAANDVIKSITKPQEKTP